MRIRKQLGGTAEARALVAEAAAVAKRCRGETIRGIDILPGDEEADRVVEELIARREVARSVLKRKETE